MENKKMGTTKKNSFGARWMLILFCVILLCVVLTFGFTLSYFGGHSNGLNGFMTIKAGINLKENGTDGTKYVSVNFDGDYMVPGTSIDALCLATVTSGVSNFEETAVNGLLRVSFGVSGALLSAVSIDVTYVDVYLGSSKADAIEDNIIGRLVKAPDNYWYLTNDATDEEIVNTTELYELDCIGNNGTVSVVFNIPIKIDDFSNENAGQQTTLTANFEVVQAEYYDYSGRLAKTYEYAKPVFDTHVAKTS